MYLQVYANTSKQQKQHHMILQYSCYTMQHPLQPASTPLQHVSTMYLTNRRCQPRGVHWVAPWVLVCWRFHPVLPVHPHYSLEQQQGCVWGDKIHAALRGVMACGWVRCVRCGHWSNMPPFDNSSTRVPATSPWCDADTHAWQAACGALVHRYAGASPKQAMLRCMVTRCCHYTELQHGAARS